LKDYGKSGPQESLRYQNVDVHAQAIARVLGKRCCVEELTYRNSAIAWQRLDERVEKLDCYGPRRRRRKRS